MSFCITEYGAVADGTTNNAAAIQKAIDAAAMQGGRVVVPAGRFLSGTLVLKSNVDLHLAPGAVLISSLNPADILDFAALFQDENACTGWDGGCFLFACHAQNVTLSGSGTLYGQGDRVFFDDNADNGAHECPLQVTEFRPRTTFFEDVENLTVEDITIRDAAFWTLHMAGCRHVRVRDIKILNDVRGANNDGIDPDCCKDVMISGCLVKTGDDAIVVKSTPPMTARYGGTENVVISNCVLYSHDSALKIGTETRGDIRHVLLSDCVFRDCSRGVGIWARDGATIEDIHIHHVSGNVLKYADGVRGHGPTMWWGNGEAVFLDATYRDARHLHPGAIRDISFDHLYLKAESCVFVAGEADARLENITLTDLNLTLCRQGTQAPGYFDEQPSERHVYPHTIPAVYARCVDGLRVEGRVRYMAPYTPAENPLLLTDDCTGVEAAGLLAR